MLITGTLSFTVSLRSGPRRSGSCELEFLSQALGGSVEKEEGYKKYKKSGIFLLHI